MGINGEREALGEERDKGKNIRIKQLKYLGYIRVQWYSEKTYLRVN